MNISGASRPLSSRLCSLIPGFGVKLFAIIPAGPTVLPPPLKWSDWKYVFDSRRDLTGSRTFSRSG
jgi:hypothetical protein